MERRPGFWTVKSIKDNLCWGWRHSLDAGADRGNRQERKTRPPKSDYSMSKESEGSWGRIKSQILFCSGGRSAGLVSSCNDSGHALNCRTRILNVFPAGVERSHRAAGGNEARYTRPAPGSPESATNAAIQYVVLWLWQILPDTPGVVPTSNTCTSSSKGDKRLRLSCAGAGDVGRRFKDLDSGGAQVGRARD